MARAPNEKVNKAYELYKQGNKLVDIASQLDIPSSTVRRWKKTYSWDNERSDKNSERSLKKNKSKKEPIVDEVKQVSKNTELTDKQRLFCIYYIKYFNATKAYKKAYECKYDVANAEGYKLLVKPCIKAEIELLKQTKLNRAMLSEEDIFQRYMDIAFSDIGDYLKFGIERTYQWTKDQDGLDIPVIDPNTGKHKYFEYNIVKLNDSNDLDTTILGEVSEGKDGVKIKLQDKMKALQWISDHINIATIEQQARIDKLRAETLKLNPPEQILDGKPFELPARVIAPPYLKAVYDIEEKEHREYIFYGGRGSTKSSFVGLETVNLIKKNPTMHALCCRKVSNTLKDSVFNQIKWAISALGLDEEFHCTTSPIEITYKATGQKIYFRGADDPTKIKSIKPPFGYIGIVWFEELDQFSGPEEIRNIEQSAIRGGDDAYIFKSFNPPKTANNWANKYIKIPKENQYQMHTTYLDVPKKWLGKTFIEEAEHLKEVNPNAYEHEYMGVPNGNGGNVFDNVTIRTITEDEIKTFDRLYFGVDWGWYPDPWAYNKVYYNAAGRKLYVIDEDRRNKTSNENTASILKNEHKVMPNDKLVCDSAENKSIGDYKSFGLFARPAVKGPGSVDYSMKWLQSLTEIIIDNVRTPETAKEFLDYEYERNKDGDVLTGYPDKDNHNIDAIRYATEEIWRRRGE